MNKLIILAFTTLTHQAVASLSLNDESSFKDIALKITASKKTRIESLAQGELPKNNKINELLTHLRIYSSDPEHVLPTIVEINKYMTTGIYDETKLFNFVFFHDELCRVSVINSQKKYNNQYFNKEMAAEYLSINQNYIDTFRKITHNIFKVKAATGNIKLKDAGILDQIDSLRKIVYLFEPEHNNFSLHSFVEHQNRPYNMSKYHFATKVNENLIDKTLIIDNQNRLVTESGLFVVHYGNKLLMDRYWGKDSTTPFSTPQNQIDYTLDEKQKGLNLTSLQIQQPLELKEKNSQNNGDILSNGFNNQIHQNKLTSNVVMGNQNSIEATLSSFSLTEGINDGESLVESIRLKEQKPNFFKTWFKEFLLNNPKDYSIFIPTSLSPANAAAEDWLFFYLLQNSPKKYLPLIKLIMAIDAAEKLVHTIQEDHSLNKPKNNVVDQQVSSNNDLLKDLQDEKKQEYITMLTQQVEIKDKERIQLEQQWQDVQRKVIEGTSGQKKSKKNIKTIKSKIITPSSKTVTILPTSKPKSKQHYINDKLDSIKTKKAIKVQEAMSLINFFLKECGINDDLDGNINVKIDGSHYVFHIEGHKPFTLVNPHGKNKGFFKGKVLYNFLANIIEIKT